MWAGKFHRLATAIFHRPHRPGPTKGPMPNASRHLSLSPTLCVCVLSHKRLDLLRTPLRLDVFDKDDTSTP